VVDARGPDLTSDEQTRFPSGEKIMRTNLPTLRQAAIVTTALIGLTGMANAAIQDTKDPTAADRSAPGAAAPRVLAPSASGNAAQVPGSNDSVTAKTEQRLSELHSKLQITQAQEPQWQKFAQAMRDNGRKMDQTFQSRVQSMATMSATDNMKSYAEISKQHAANVESLIPVFDALYASMSQSQKHTADQVFRDDAHRGDPAQHS
jgi:periplasmic protein CpxP/Spy